MEGAIAHPEHMKRDNVIYMSTSVGDAYYFQTTSQTEVDAWIKAIHSGKCVVCVRLQGSTAKWLGY